MIKGLSVSLSHTQMEFLIDHFVMYPEPRPVYRNHRNHLEDPTRTALLRMKLIRYEPNENLVGRPKGTLLTNTGHCACCHIIAWMDDQLTRAKETKERPAFMLASYKHELAEAFK